ncbi:MAG: hypothetical protein U5J96_08800 [Ignavibacteriaceae bacterium]|nr:hypothetical protein [Ignavibacteriaceae bacterium]
MNKELNYDTSTGNYKAEYFYIVDEIPGNAYFNQNSFSNNNEWYNDLSLIIQFTPTEIKEGTSILIYSLKTTPTHSTHPLQSDMKSLSKVLSQ